jgi:hypothetical protein
VKPGMRLPMRHAPIRFLQLALGSYRPLATA